MPWYVAVLVVTSRVDSDAGDEPLSELQYRLICASDREAAFDKAFELGLSEGTSYLNGDDERVDWQFAGLHDLTEITASEIVDGTEIYGRMVRTKENLVASRDQLTVFWLEANRDRPVDDFLD